jgi:ubiquinone/menaquinone biosynthesis C-methylase UbiE
MVKGRDSGMPGEDYWNSFFDAECVVKKLFGKNGCQGDVVEFGSGYGTFTFPAAKYTSGYVHVFDIESELIEKLRQKATGLSIFNIVPEIRDFFDDGTGLEPESQSHAMIYNLLHIEDPYKLLKEAYRILRPEGILSVIHWRSDVPTPRGPSLKIRPVPAQCKRWIEETGFRSIQEVSLQECCQFHFGITAVR